MSKQRRVIELDLAPDQALAACRRAIADLTWTLEESGGQGDVTGRERPEILCCHNAPVRVEAEVQPAPHDRASVEVRGSVPGWGPVSSEHLRSRMEAFERRLRLSAGSA
jgi:hypothetical protein